MRQSSLSQYVVRAQSVGLAILAVALPVASSLAQQPLPTTKPASIPALEEADEVQLTSQAEEIEQTLAKAFELADQIEKQTLHDQAWLRAYTEAAERSNSVLKVDPLNVKARYIQGRLAILNGKPRDALPLIEAYVRDRVGATDAHAHELLGDLYLVSYAETARARYNDAAKLAPDRPEPLIGLAKAQIKLNRAEEAVENARAGIAADKENVAKYRQVLAEALLLLKDKQAEAAEAARAAVEITELKIRENPNDILLFNELRAEYELLVRCYNEQYKVQKDKADVVVNVVRTMQDQADLDRLIAYHNALILVQEARKDEALRESDILLYEQARLYRLLGRDDLAGEALKFLLEKHPDHDAGRELLQLIDDATPADTPASGDLSTASAPQP